jgi:chemotaxis protein methyltransferase CheR
VTATGENIFEKIAFEKLKKHLLESVGVNCDGYRPEYLKRRLDLRIKATNSKSYSDYLRYLRANPEENEQLMNQVTINYTTFFRDSAVYAYLKNTLFPELLSAKVLRVWSAGCASGEEPYSLAILLSDLFRSTGKNVQVTIYASDIDKDALDKAIKGEYAKNQLQGLTEEQVNRYFSVVGDKYIVKDQLKRMIHFSIHDLMKPFSHKCLDLILCRNVMIYFAKESQQSVHMLFYEALREGGYMVTGNTEILSGEPAKKFQCIDVRTRVYRKPKQSLFNGGEQGVSFVVGEAKPKVV